MYDVIIVGAGPAGLTSAIFARRANLKVLLLEALQYGGQIVNSIHIENYPVEPHISGFDFATKLYQQVKDLGCDIYFEKVVSLEDFSSYKEVVTEENRYSTKTVILATGASCRRLGLPNEKEFVGKGVSYCATCDGAFFKNLDVAVVGGGNTALEDACYLADLARSVYLIHRRNEFRGDACLLETLKEKKNVHFLTPYQIIEIQGREKLEKLVIQNLEGEVSTLSIHGLFIAIGRDPENKFCSNLIPCDSNGYIIAGENCHTNLPGVFVAGDNRTKSLRQLVTATSDGAIAANEAILYLRTK